MKNNQRRSIIIILSIIILTWYVSNYWIQFTLIQGDSMLPSYHNLQLVLIDRHTNEFSYDDVIVFVSDTLNSTMVKRVIALPGDTVQITDGILYVNNQPSPLIAANTKLSYSGIASSVLHLSMDEYFVLGDNFEKSKDSRYSEIGCIKQNTILGKLIN